MSFQNTRTVLLLAAILVVALTVPPLLPRYFVDVLVFTCLYAIAGLGVALLLGQCGIVNLAQGFFYGVGAYTSAYVTATLGFPILAGVCAGVAISAAIAYAVGAPVLRLKGFFLSLATLGIAMIGNIIFFEWDWLTGGSLGVGGLPYVTFGNFVLNTPIRYYYLVLAVLLLCLLGARNLINGRAGLAMQAMRDAPSAAEVIGIEIQRLRTQMFVVCAGLGALAGSLLAHYTSYVSVESFTIERSILFLLIPVIAGSRSVGGVVLGALFVTLLPEFLSQFGDIHRVLFGLSLVLVVFFLPEGLLSLPGRLAQMRSRRERR